MLKGKEIYFLKWMPSGTVPKDGPAYVDKTQAKAAAEYANKRRKWYHRLNGGMWVVSTLILKEGPKNV